MKWRCAACGGPRIPASKSAEVGASPELALLVKAHRANGAAYFWNGAAFALSGAVAVTGILGLLLFKLSVVAAIILLALCASSFLGVRWARGSRDANRKETVESIDGAWREAAKSILSHAGRGLSAKDLGRALGILPAFAETLLTQLSVSDEVRTRISDDADIMYEASVTESEEETAKAR